MKLKMHKRHLWCADFFVEELYKHVRPKKYNQYLISLLLLGYYDVS